MSELRAVQVFCTVDSEPLARDLASALVEGYPAYLDDRGVRLRPSGPPLAP